MKSLAIEKTSKGQWLLLPVENKSREFDAKLYLGCIAAERGWKVLIGHYGAFRRWISCLPRGVFLEKCISINKADLIKRYGSLGYRIVVSDEESFSVYVEPEAFIQNRLNETTLSMTDLVFAWGKQQADVVKNAYPEYANKVIATGTPKADLWRKELHGLYEEEVKDIQDRFGRFILMPSNFADVINVKGPEFVIGQAKKYGYLRSSSEELLLRERIDHNKTNLEAVVDVLRLIREKIPSHAIIIRPHPTDDHRYWKESIKEITNTHVIYEGSPAPWLLAADAIFHHGCSTGLEARLLGRCSTAYHPVYDKRFDCHPSTIVGPVAGDNERLIDFLKDSVQRGGVCELKHGEINRYFDAMDGKFASERVLDALETVNCKEDSLDLMWTNPRAAVVRLHEGWRGIRKRIRQMNRWDEQRRLVKMKRSRQKWPGTSVDEVRTIIAKFNNVTGRFSGVRAEEVTPDIMYVAVEEKEKD